MFTLQISIKTLKMEASRENSQKIITKQVFHLTNQQVVPIQVW